MALVARIIDSDIRKYTLTWQSSSGGAVDFTTPAIAGELIGIEFDPGATAPTANYDITLTDENGLDVMAGQGANLSATVTTMVKPGIPFKDGVTTSVAPMIVHGTLVLAITNAGDTKNGVIVLYMR